MKKIKWFLLVAVGVLSLGCIAVVLVLAFYGQRPAADWDQANACFQRGDYDAAEPMLIALVREDQTHEAAFRLLARIAEARKQYALAADLWRQVRGLNPLDVELPMRQARMALNAGLYEMVVELFQNRQSRGELRPEEVGAYWEAMIRLGNSAEATAMLATDEAAALAEQERNYLAGILALQAEDFGLAGSLLEDFVQRGADEDRKFRALQELAILAGLRGEPAVTEKHLLAAAALNPEVGALALAQFYRFSGRLDEARPYYEQSLTFFPASNTARTELAEIYAAKNEVSAIAALAKKRHPQDQADVENNAYLNALVAFLEERPADVLAALDLAPRYGTRAMFGFMKLRGLVATAEVKSLDATIQALLQAAGGGAESGERIAGELTPLMVRFLSENRLAEAAVAAEWVAKLTPEALPRKRMATQILMVDAFNRRDYLKTRNLASQVLEWDPNNAAAVSVLAEALLAGGLPEQSVAYFERMPESTLRAIGLGRAFEKMKRLDLAEAQYVQARRLEPDNADAAGMYVGFLLRQQRWDEVLAMAAALGTEPMARYEAHLLEAQVAAAQGNAAAEAQAYAAAAGIWSTFPETPEQQYQLAYLYAVSNQDRLAADIYLKLLQERPNWGLVLVNLSEVLVVLGEPAAALEYAETARRLYPEWQAAVECLNRRSSEALAVKAAAQAAEAAADAAARAEAAAAKAAAEAEAAQP